MARLRFAHAETLLPFSCLIGLFLDESGEAFIIYYLYGLPFFFIPSSFFSFFVGWQLRFDLYSVPAGFSDFNKILREEPLQLPPKPPQTRIWRGSTVAPFAGNNMLVLYSCPANNTSKYFVQVLHNERPTQMAVSLLWFYVFKSIGFLFLVEFEKF